MKNFLVTVAAGMAASVVLGSFPASLRADNPVYQKVAPTTVGFYERIVAGTRVFDGLSGSGVLVDAERKIVVTAEHVVRDQVRAGHGKVMVMFPRKDDKGNVITDARYYQKKRNAPFRIPGTVIYHNRLKDLALVRLDRVPEGATAISLAKKGPGIGDRVHVLGNSTFFLTTSDFRVTGGAFGYSTGYIRNIYHSDDETLDTPPAFVLGPITQIFRALAHHSPSNPGDSGGPVVNDAGELVGIHSQSRISGRIQSWKESVHLDEIRRALEGIQLPATDIITMKLSADSDADADSPSLDNFYIPVVKGETVHVELQGNGQTDLDLYVKDIDRRAEKIDKKTGKKTTDPSLMRRLLAEVGTTDQEKGSFTPDWTGTCLVQVVNLGDAKNQNFRNDYTLKIQRKNKVPGVFTAIRQLAPGGTDLIQIPYEAGKGKARVSLRGDGDMNLDLIVLDPEGRKVGEGIGPTDIEEVTWTPTVSGTYTIRVESKNPLGDRKTPIWAQYILTTD